MSTISVTYNFDANPDEMLEMASMFEVLKKEGITREPEIHGLNKPPNTFHRRPAKPGRLLMYSPGVELPAKLQMFKTSVAAFRALKTLAPSKPFRRSTLTNRARKEMRADGLSETSASSAITSLIKHNVVEFVR